VKTLLAILVAAAGSASLHGQDPGFRFRSDVELISVTATVSDSSGRFVANLRKEDFAVYEDDQLQTVSHFAAERVPVSLGIVLDTSGSMAGEKMQAARTALRRFLSELLHPEDEVFLYGFSDTPVLLQGWTTERERVSRALDRVRPEGATSLYDAVADAIPLAAKGTHRKKALVLISDGNDTSSSVAARELKQLIRESEVLVYAIGIDGPGGGAPARRPPIISPPSPMPFPFPPGRGRRWPPQRLPPQPQPQSGGWSTGSRDDRVNVVALRDMTDDSGGRTEIIRSAFDLDPATAGIADELSQQSFLGYSAPGKKDGRWHSIRVEVTRGSYRVRARRGYVAS
jgi:Ca-activated chloride channel family protein